MKNPNSRSQVQTFILLISFLIFVSNRFTQNIMWNAPINIKIEIKDIQNFTIQEKTLYLEDLQAK